MYGPTETTIWSAVSQVQAGSGSVSIGRAIANTQFYILDANLQPVAVGVAGELHIGGDGLARGYLNRPELTAEKFIPNPFGHAGSRLYKTGDLVRYKSDGNIEYLGRIDNQVKVRGFRIELTEIEALLSQHLTVQQAVVIAKEIAGDKRLVAYLVPQTEATPATHELRSFLKQQLPEYMVPSYFVVLDTLPLTPNGKVDRNALPDPDPDHTALEVSAYVAPRNEVERLLSAVWLEVLNLEKVGVNDNFFELGGHSLLIVQLHSKLNQTLLGKIYRDISVVDLFKYPTISTLAQYLGQEQDGSTSTLQKINARASKRTDAEPIAIVGMAGRFPGAKNVDEFWQNLREGVESISFFSDEELEAQGIDPALLKNQNYVKANGLLSDVEMFDASFFGFTPKEAEIMDPQHRLFLECAWEVLENAGYNSETYDGQIGVYAGAGLNAYLLYNLVSNRDRIESFGNYQTFISNDKDFVPTRVSYKLNLTGPSVNVSTACSTSLVAVQMGCQSLLNYQCDMVLAGGVSVGITQKTGYLYQEGMIFSPDGHCRAFDAESQGTISGNGVGIVLLKRLSDALADGDCIHAVIRGVAINNDGSLKVGYTAPSIEGQAAVISEAQAIAQIEAETISYVEAHGTGTVLGDPIEIAALTQAFRATTQKKGFCAIGSVKTNIGHLDTAAGVASLIKTVMALKHKMLPPSLHFEQPNPKIDFANSPFYVNTTLREWKTDGTKRRAGVSSFGIGGTNAHVILEEAPTVETEDLRSVHSRPWQLLVLSAKTESALDTATVNLAEHLKTHPEINLADVAYTQSIGRRAFEHRRILVGSDVNYVANALNPLDPERVLTSFIEPKARPVVFMFSGQGAQYVNMALELYQSEPTFREQVDICSEILKPHLGLDLRHVLYPSEELIEVAAEQIKQTAIAQPALFTIEYALAKLWMEWGVRPQAAIGHSIGEYVAACLANVFSLEDALALVTARGQLMQQLPCGAMLSVPLPEEKVQTLLGKELSLAAVNGPSFCVVSGVTEAVEALEKHLAEQGVECRRLHTSHAFHSNMMEPILEEFTERVKKVSLNPPQMAYVSNVTGTWITAAEATNPEYWANHLRSTVRFAEGVQQLLNEPEQILLEVGPGRTLSTLVRQHPNQAAQQVVLSSLRHPQDCQSDVAFLLTTLGKLWLAGVQVDWSGFYACEQRHRLPLPTYPFEHQRYWIEPQKSPDRVKTHQVSLDKNPDIRDWFYTPFWKSSMPPMLSHQPDMARQKSCWLVFSDECGLSSRMVKRLEQKDQDVITVRVGKQFAKLSHCVYTLNPGQRDDYDVLLKELQALGKTPETILHMWSITPNEQTPLSIEFFEKSQDLGFYSLLFLAQALGKQNSTQPLQIGVLSNNMHEVTGFEVLSPEKATLLGPCKVIPQEYPHIRCCSIDIVIPESGIWEDKLIDRILSEFSAKSPNLVVAYRGNHRWVQSFELVQLDESVERTPQLRSQGVYLITGGLGGIGLVLAEYLARTVQARLILIGRSGLPDKNEWEQWIATHDDQDDITRKIAKVQLMEKLGAEVLVKKADVANVEQMQAAIAQIYEKFGEIHGVIHAAGITGKESVSSIQEIDLARCEQQFQPKVHGLFVLKKVLEGKTLDFCILTSSLSTVLGGLGYAAYSAANLFMDAFAYKCNQINAMPWISVNWDGWKFEEEQNIAFETTLAKLAITSNEGVEVFQHVLSTYAAASQIVISTGNLQARIDQWIKLESLQNTKSSKKVDSSSLHLRPNRHNAYVAPSNEIEQTITDIWQELFGIEQIGIYDDFFEIGGHSLLATQFISQLRTTFCVELPLSSLFETTTIAKLAELIEEMLIEKLEELPEEEVRLL
ncbi:SDR family NAD(P)-dependent oxidoreductase [Scytonema sp. NUACC26]|uniref:SDR family NAD(P)-dependent oxidoreductase n=1 Tax=Scytonema sp. NUACC26 TaxID=3140176 RepID=UPI0038B347D3